MSSTTPSQSNALALADLPDPEAMLFDLDGTLVDTVGLRIEAWGRALAGIGVIVDRDRLGAYIGSDGRRLALELAREAGRELDYATTDELDQIAGANFDTLNTAPAPLPGATELLTKLEASGLTFAIATSSLPGQVAASVNALELPSPPPVTDGSHVAHAKPEPDLLLASAAQLGVVPERCWYIGDSTWDMMASVRAGLVAVGVTTGAADAEALTSAGAAVAVGSLVEVLDELRRRGVLR